MPLLGPDDLLPSRPQRVLVNGTSGSGKSTLARLIGEQLDLPYTELDSLFHGPAWVPRETFRQDVDRFSSQDQWVTEFQYDPVRPMLAERADLFVWLDLPRRLVMMRLVRRTLSRRWRRTALWNGGCEARHCIPSSPTPSTSSATPGGHTPRPQNEHGLRSRLIQACSWCG